MLASGVAIESDQSFPPDHRERRVQSIQFRDLYVRRVFIFHLIVVAKRHVPLKMVMLVGPASQHSDNALQSVRSTHYAHPDVDEGYALFEQPFNERPLRFARIETQERERDAFEQMQVVPGQRLVVLREATTAQLA